MTTRRSTSRRRRSSGSASGPEAATSGSRKRGERSPKTDASGKLAISCPHCGSKYKVPESVLGSSLSCKNCKRAFVARPPGERKRAGTARKSDTNTYIAIGAGIVGLVVVLIVAANLGGGEVEYAKIETPKESVNIRWGNPRVQKAAEWVRAVHGNDKFNLARLTDLGALQKQLGVEPDTALATAAPDDKERIKEAIFAKLAESDETLVFREFNPTNGELSSVADATAETGTVELFLKPYDPKKYGGASKSYQGQLEATAKVTFRAEGDNGERILVTGFEPGRVPRAKRPPRKKAHKPHEKIAAPTTREIDFHGQKTTITESELTPLDHLEDTPPELRKEIDDLIETAMDTELGGHKVNAARRRLEQIGKPAVPRLLNKMYEFTTGKGSSMTEDDVRALTGVVYTLRHMTGVAFGFSAVRRESAGKGATDAERISALKQWYAWWYVNANNPNFRNIDDADDESLFEVDADPKKQDTTSKSRVMK